MWAKADFLGRGFISHVLLMEGSCLKLVCRNRREIRYSSKLGREVGVGFRPQVCPKLGSDSTVVWERQIDPMPPLPQASRGEVVHMFLLGMAGAHSQPEGVEVGPE